MPTESTTPNEESRRLSRILILGLDSADADLIDGWCDQGYLPTLKRLREEGAWGRLETTADVMHVSAWPSLQTGAGPQHHGLYHAYQVHAGRQGVYRTRPSESGLPPFWRFLDDAGLKCIIMDAFMDHPLRGFQGIQILEYGSWTWFVDPGATPKGLWREIIRRFGKYPAPEHTQVLNVPAPAAFRDQLVAGAGCKAEVVRWLLTTEPWDFAFVNFAEPHGAGHYLWHIDDPEYPAHPEIVEAGLEHPLRDVYVAVDHAIGEIVQELDESTTLFVTSGDGMGPNYAGCHLMPEFLSRLGLFASSSVGAATAKEPGATSSGRSGGDLLSRIRGSIPIGFRHAVSRCLPRELHYRMSMRWVNSEIDWRQSRAICLPNANEGYFRVNLTGREPRGIVPPGQEYEELLDLLADNLRCLVNPRNGVAAVKDIVRADEALRGPQRQNLPDLVATWEPEARILSEIHSERLGTVRHKAGYEISPCYTGNHRPNAFLLVHGPGVARDRTLAGGNILDIAPTVLNRYGVDAPEHFEGRALVELQDDQPA